MVKKSDQIVAELCKNGGLDDYREILTQIIFQIRKSGCKISCQYMDHRSSIQQPFEGENHIRISVLSKREYPIQLIWEILHEYGHHLSGKTTTPGLMRENLAWDYAFIEFKKYFQAEDEFDSFEKYKKYCLGTYS